MSLRARCLPFLATLALLGISQVTTAQVSIDSVVTPMGSQFQYDYTVNNTSSDITFFTVSIVSIPSIDAIDPMSLTAPLGYMINFDSGNGLLTLLADASSFDPLTSVGGFSFKSSFGPGSTPFEALGLDLSANAVNVSGSTVGLVPEPGTIAFGLALTGAAGFAFYRRRRR